MNTYELMIKTNHYLLNDGVLTEKQKKIITQRFLAAVCDDKSAQRFYQGVKYPDNTNAQGQQMYPVFYIPPYNNGKKYPTVTGQMPKTHLLSANAYELEILRLLYLLDPESPEVLPMMKQTLARLKTTCFGNDTCGTGECFDCSLIVLRFLATATPAETQWTKERIANYRHHFDEKQRPLRVRGYYWLCLSEIPIELAKNEIEFDKGEMLRQLSSGRIKAYPAVSAAARNALARLGNNG